MVMVLGIFPLAKTKKAFSSDFTRGVDCTRRSLRHWRARRFIMAVFGFSRLAHKIMSNLYS